MMNLAHMCILDHVVDIMFQTQVGIQKNNVAHFTNDLKDALDMVYERLFSPILWPDWIYSLTGKQKKFEKIIARGTALVQEVVEQKIESRKKMMETQPTAERPQTYLELLFKSFESGIMTKDRVHEEALEMAIAASVTTAVTISWVFKLLAMFPEFQQKAYQEAVDSCSEGRITLDNLPKLVYVEMFIKETLRHYSSPISARMMVKDLVINDKLTIPAGIRVLLGMFELHHDPLYWEKPYEFYPEHFSVANEETRPKGAYIPFMTGPRGCPGYKTAMRLLKFIVAQTLLNFELLTDEKPFKDIWDLEYRLILMIWPAEGFKVAVRRRSHNP